MEGPITEAERARIIWYTQHIRILHMYSTWRLDSSVFEYLSPAALGFPLAPRVHTLCGSWYAIPHQSEAVALLSGPALRTLSVTFAGSETVPASADGRFARQYRPIVRALLADVAVSAPALESLAVHDIPHMSLLEPAGTLRSLLTLNLSKLRHSFDLEFLRALEPLDRLEELQLGDHFVPGSAPPCSGFRRLQTLVVVNGISTVPDLLAALPNARLKELRSYGVSHGRLRQIEALAKALCAGPGQLLESLSLLSFVGEEQLMQEPVSVLLGPFFALQGIKRFTLFAWQRLSIGDEDLQKLGRAWPKLELLHMPSDFVDAARGAVDAPTIEGIVELANACPGLNDTQFTSIIPARAPGDVVPPINLKRETIYRIPLDVGIPDERIRDVGQVTRVLHAALGRLLVPRLDRRRYRRWSAVLDGMTRLSRG